MSQFQQLMSQFLQTQALVMTAYLQGAPANGIVVAPPTLATRTPAPRLQEPVRATPPAAVIPAPRAAASPTHAAMAPQSVLTAVPPQPTPAARVAAAPPALQKPHAEPPSADTRVIAQLLDIVSDRTGYPLDMLSVDAHIEADLGIDSIKRMEILTTFQQRHAADQSSSLQGAMERLTSMKTLKETATVLEELLASQQADSTRVAV